MNAAAIAHGLKFMRGKLAGWMVGEAPHHAVLVVDWNEGMAVERIVAVRRYHGVKRHDPLRDAPIKLACHCRPPHADDHTAFGFDHFESNIGLASEFSALADVQRIA